MEKPYRILLVADERTSVEPIERAIRRAEPHICFAQAQSREEYLAALRQLQPDLIIVGASHLDSLDTLRLGQLHAPLVPAIVFADTADEAAVVECLHAGATDYVTQANIERLGPAASRALRIRASGGADADLQLAQYCLDHAAVGVMRIGADARIAGANHEICRLLGYSAEEVCRLCITDIDPNTSVERWHARRRDLRAQGSVTSSSEYRRKDGTLLPVEITSTYLEFQGQAFELAVVHDISDRKRAEDNQARLDQQQLQSQKMESIGQLAGGVAHDFNNLLTVIQGYCGIIEQEMPANSPLLEELGQIRLASQRAAALTRQLLTFSRKQILSPTVLSLNDLIANLRKMLERLIGEDITLITTLDPLLRPVIADAGQVEQLIMNLAINARDAMPIGGVLTIETGNLELDDGYALAHPDAPSGPCVMLAVTDTGTGMDEPTLARVFEPFFTTKPAGKGTGLGLATVYGIVKQSGGEVTVTSQLQRGSTFQIVLPASTSAADDQAPAPPHPVAAGGSETLLLVEDDALVRKLVRAVLRNEGYTIIEATHGQEALATAQQHHGPIDLLVTDVVMPQMSGRELAEKLKLARPEIKVLFMSGYTDDAVVRHGLRMARIDLLAKPFSPLKLAAKVREVLDKAPVPLAEPAPAYYQEAHGALTRSFDITHGAANTRSFAQAMFVQGNVLTMMGDLAAASDHFARSHAIFQALGDRSNQALLLERLGWTAREQANAAAALAWLEESIALSRDLGDRQQVAWALLTMAEVAVLQENPARAEALVEQANALGPESHDWLSWSLNHLGHAAQLRGDYSRAAHLHQKSHEMFLERLGDKSTGMMWAYQGLAEAALGQGDPIAARQWLGASLRLCHELGARIVTTWCLAGFGTAAALEGDMGRAATLWGAAEQLRAALGARPAPAARATYERQVELARARLGQPAFAAAWVAGEGLPAEQLVADILASTPGSAQPGE